MNDGGGMSGKIAACSFRYCPIAELHIECRLSSRTRSVITAARREVASCKPGVASVVCVNFSE